MAPSDPSKTRGRFKKHWYASPPRWAGSPAVLSSPASSSGRLPRRPPRSPSASRAGGMPPSQTPLLRHCTFPRMPRSTKRPGARTCARQKSPTATPRHNDPTSRSPTLVRRHCPRPPSPRSRATRRPTRPRSHPKRTVGAPRSRNPRPCQQNLPCSSRWCSAVPWDWPRSLRRGCSTSTPRSPTSRPSPPRRPSPPLRPLYRSSRQKTPSSKLRSKPRRRPRPPQVPSHGPRPGAPRPRPRPRNRPNRHARRVRLPRLLRPHAARRLVKHGSSANRNHVAASSVGRCRGDTTAASTTDAAPSK